MLMLPARLKTRKPFSAKEDEFNQKMHKNCLPQIVYNFYLKWWVSNMRPAKGVYAARVPLKKCKLKGFLLKCWNFYAV